MSRRNRRGWLPLLLALLLASGCGSPAADPGALPAGDFGAPRVTVAATPEFHGLGGKLTGVPLAADDGGLVASLPARMDLRAQMSAVGDQGKLGSCCAFAVVKGLREYLLRRESKPPTSLSPAFVWSLGRRDMGYPPDQNDGVYVEVGMKVLQSVGTIPEADFPYIPAADQEDPAKLRAFLTRSPGPAQLQAAQAYRIPGIKPLKSLQAIKSTLAAGYPVIIGFFVYDSFYNHLPADAVATVPDTEKEQQFSSHIVTLAGYDEARKVFIVKNSWGDRWGDRGYFYMPYAWVTKGIALDAWTVSYR